MTQSLEVENALLRGSLYLAYRVLRDYQAGGKEIEVDGVSMVQVTVPASVRDRGADAVARAEQLLNEGRGRG